MSIRKRNCARLKAFGQKIEKSSKILGTKVKGGNKLKMKTMVELIRTKKNLKKKGYDFG